MKNDTKERLEEYLFLFVFFLAVLTMLLIAGFFCSILLAIWLNTLFYLGLAVKFLFSTLIIGCLTVGLNNALNDPLDLE